MKSTYAAMWAASSYAMEAALAYKKAMRPIEKSEEEIKEEEIKVKPINSLPDNCATKVNIYV